MSKKTVALLGLALGPITVVLLDLLFTRSGATEPFFRNTREFVRSTAVAAWPVGVLIGHWYYPGDRAPIVRRDLNYVVLIVLSLLIMVVTVLMYWGGVRWSFVCTIAFVAGLFAGTLLWAMGGPPAPRPAASPTEQRVAR